MVKGHLNSLICSFLTLLTLLSGCYKRESDLATEKLKSYIKATYSFEIEKNIKRIFILNDTGCGNCIYSLSELIKENINDSRTLIIVNSQGANIDIEGFQNKKITNSNIIINYRPIKDKDNIFYESAIIYMNENKIDTIISLNIENISDQIEYILNENF